MVWIHTLIGIVVGFVAGFGFSWAWRTFVDDGYRWW
jgi:ABC-type antimicrobial peptide transport system permease subunit